jgi:hypothetical protein
MGRPLLGLAALALEGLQQDGLLAQHVGALDGPDGDRDAAPGAQHGRPDEPGVLGRADRALEPADDLVASARTAMNASLAPIENAAIATPSTTANGFDSRSVRSVATDGSAP